MDAIGKGDIPESKKRVTGKLEHYDFKVANVFYSTIKPKTILGEVFQYAKQNHFEEIDISENAWKLTFKVTEEPEELPYYPDSSDEDDEDENDDEDEHEAEAEDEEEESETKAETKAKAKAKAEFKIDPEELELRVKIQVEVLEAKNKKHFGVLFSRIEGCSELMRKTVDKMRKELASYNSTREGTEY